MKLSSYTQYYNLALRTAESLLVSANQTIHETYEEELHEFHTLSSYVRTETEHGKDLYDEMTLLMGISEKLSDCINSLRMILPKKEAPNG